MRSVGPFTMAPVTMATAVLLMMAATAVQGIYLQGSQRSYAQYPKWNACRNASLSFEFQTTQQEGLLMYVDDGGQYDFFDVHFSAGRVRVELNIVDGKDGYVKLDAGRNVNDGRWHKVEIIRNRMETTLIVDGQRDNNYAFGSDFNFGNLERNSYVYFGGLPSGYDIHNLANPSVLYTHERLRGYIRNVIYGNCSCIPVRAPLVDGEGVSQRESEACERSDPCNADCVCVSEDNAPKCDCSKAADCNLDVVVHYSLPFDAMDGSTIINPSGLDASAFGNPVLVPGVLNNAIRLETPRQYVRVTGPGHRYECFGDLNKCTKGHTLSFWVNFENPIDGEVVYLSNGGHTDQSHGVAMMYSNGQLEFRYRRKTGEEWNTKTENITPGKWYHIATSWSFLEGLSLYVNGQFKDRDRSPGMRSPESVTEDYSEFFIGKKNDDTSSKPPLHSNKTILVDEFNFWSEYKTADQIKELGPFAHFHLPMDLKRGSEFIDTTWRNRIYGNPDLVAAKVNDGMKCDGRRKYVDLMDQQNACMGDLTKCQHGLYTSMWVKFDELQDEMYILDSGSKGFKWYIKNGKLFCEYQRGNQNWKLSYGDIKVGKWYFLEASYKADDGVRLWSNLQQVAHQGQHTYKQPLEGESHMYLGRANGNMIKERYFEGTADELEVWYADRQTLIDMGYIQRGRPFMYYFDMETISGNKLVNAQHLDVDCNGRRRVETVEGQIGQALRLDGRWQQYADLGQHNDTCLGNLDKCRHGAMLGGWVRLADMRNGAYLYHTGQNGFKVKYDNGRLVASASTSENTWNVNHGDLSADQWYFVEYTWHPTRGFKVYVDNQLVGEDKTPTKRTPADLTSSEANTVYFGRGADLNQGTADVSLDEVEYWYSNRDYLVAFDFIQRGKPEHLLIDMDQVRSGHIVHPYITARVYGNAGTTTGRINNAVRLDGRSQYIDIGDHGDSCLGNMTNCRHGYTGSMYLNVKDFRDNDYYLSTGNGMNIYYRNGRMNFVVYDPASRRRWLVEVPGLRREQWYNLQYTWHKDRGLRVYVDNKLVGQSRGEPYYSFQPGQRFDVLIGRGNPGSTPPGGSNYANFDVDNFEVWYMDRDDLIRIGELQTPDDIEHFYIPLEVQMGNIVAHESLRIVLFDGASIVPAYLNNGATMDGTRQFVSLGEQKNCMGDLDKCKNGITYTFHVNARKLDDHTYLLSAGPYSVYLLNGQLYAEMATADKKWQVRGEGIEANKWYRIDVTWTKDKGMELYVNNVLRGSDRTPQRTSTNIVDYNVYLGRPNGRTRGRHLDGRIDEVEYWFAPRDLLIDMGILDPNVVPTEPPTTTTSTTTTTATPPTTTPEHVPTLVFDSNNWVLYDWSQLPEDYFRRNDREQFRIKFRSKDPNGLLWFTGTHDRNMHLSLKNGALLLVVDHGDGNTDRFRVRGRGRHDDNEWHTVTIIRDGRKVTLDVNGQRFDQMLTNDAQMIGFGALTLGGSDDVQDLTDSHVRNRLSGEIMEAVISGNHLRSDVDLTDLFFRTPRPGYVIINGPFPRFGPKETAVTIREPSSYIKLPDLDWEPRQGGKIEFKFRTAQRHGLLLYNGGRPGLRDFIAVEMHDGKLYFNVDMGPGVNRYPFSDEPINDGQPHEVIIEKTGNIFKLTLDGRTTQHVVPGSDQSLDLGNDLYLGGVNNRVAPMLPWHLWTRVPGSGSAKPKFYVGCVWDVKLNDGKLFLDLPKLVQEQVMPGIDAGCAPPDMQCQLNPCAHGMCRSTAGGFVCDCAGTPYTGDRCHEKAPIVTFDGTDFLRVNIRPTMETHTNDISLRFKTYKPDGILFVTSNRNNGGKMTVDLHGGRARLTTNLGGQEREIYAGKDLNDETWHTLYVRRRADHLEFWVDNNPPQKVELPGEGWTLDIDQILMAANGPDASVDDTYIGYMQNFFFNDYRYIEHVDPNDVGPGVIISDREKPIPVYRVTFVSPTDSYLTLPSLQVSDGFEVSLMFKTQERNGLLLYNDGLGSEFLAMELVEGYLHLIYDDGTGTKLLRAAVGNLNDDKWHEVILRRPPGENFELTLDGVATRLPANVRKDRMQLRGELYIGGLPRERYANLPEQINSKHGYRGCMASLRIQRKLTHMLQDALTKTNFLQAGCTTVTAFCKPDTCRNGGLCLEGWNTFICDCNMTSFVGRICTDEAEGYRYADYGRAIAVYNYPDPLPSPAQDELAFAFMSWFANGTLVRVDSVDSNDFLDISLVNGYVVATYNIGDGTFRMVEDRRNFSDGAYHVVRFSRKGPDASLRVDDFPAHTITPTGTSVRLFNGQSVIRVGANRAVNGTLYDAFNGILAGVYFNGVRVIDRTIFADVNSQVEGEYWLAKHPFYLPPPLPPTVKPTPVVTPKPGPDGPDVGPGDHTADPGAVIPEQPVTGTIIPLPSVPDHVPFGQGGGGVAFREFGPGGEGIFVAVDPGGAGGGIPAPGGGAALPVVSAAGATGGVEGGRAIAAAGAMLGILMLGSSLVWALYKCKPGLLSGLGAGAGGGATKKGMAISRPTPTNYQLVNQNGPPYATVAKVDANGGVAVEAFSNSANASTQTSAEMAALANYFSSSAVTASGISNTMMAGAGFMSRAAQTDMAAGGFAGAPMMGTLKASSETQTTQDLVDLNAAAQQLVQQSGYNNYNEMNSYSTMQQQYSSYQMSQMSQNIQSSSGYTQNLMAAEEIRVDCAMMTGDSRYVITGSINGPPQVWDMKSGNLVRIMGGENLSSTDVHLACNDTLMVGQVAEMAQVDPTDNMAATRVQNRKLQLWDIASGQPLEMAQSELCTASCMMKDGERIVLGRTEKFGGGTTVVIWDLLANEPVRKLHYDGAVGFADHISYISLSQDNRYVIAGFQNSYDGNANFIIFDLTVDDYNRVEPKIIALDANAECTAILPNHEAVTGTRQGELVIWSMRTGKPLRQLVATGNKAMSMTRAGNLALACAHTAEVKSVAVSDDDKLLASASSDCTIKVWNLETEKVIHTLRGHTDEVLCCTISSDNEILVSGSKDGTIRLWKAYDGTPVTQFYTGIDIFKVIMSKNKHYIVGLGDREGARKLVMLQVVRQKTRSRAPSRATSPYGTSSRPTSPYNRSTSPYGTSPHHRPISPYR